MCAMSTVACGVHICVTWIQLSVVYIYVCHEYSCVWCTHMCDMNTYRLVCGVSHSYVWWRGYSCCVCCIAFIYVTHILICVTWIHIALCVVDRIHTCNIYTHMCDMNTYSLVCGVHHTHVYMYSCHTYENTCHMYECGTPHIYICMHICDMNTHMCDMSTYSPVHLECGVFISHT